MSVDVFGRHLKSDAEGPSSRGPPGIGFQLTTDGNYDLLNKRLSNLATPVSPHDAVTLEALNEKIKQFEFDLHSKFADINKRISKLKFRDLMYEKKSLNNVSK